MRTILLFIMLTFLVGCRASYNIEKYYDEFDGYRVERLNGNYLLDNKWTPQNTIEFCPQRYTNKNEDATYQFYIRYMGKEWLFIESGESFVLLVDDERIGLVGPGSKNYRKVLDNDIEYAIEEIAIFDIEKELLLKISNASIVKLKLIGKARDAKWQLSNSHKKNIKKFYNEY